MILLFFSLKFWVMDYYSSAKRSGRNKVYILQGSSPFPLQKIHPIQPDLFNPPDS
jgi:hypothetical protein